MGWTYLHRDKGTSDRDFFLKDFDAGTVFHAWGTVAGTFYAAVETPREPGKVWALVAMTNWAPKDYFNFGFKDMSEDSGPYHCQAPLSVLNALTPTDNNYALEWRDRVVHHHEQRKALRGLQAGDQVVLTTALRFTNGEERDTFTIQRKVIRGGRTRAVLTDGDYTPYRIPNWQDMTLAVIRDGERMDTPLVARQEENRYVSAVERLMGDDESRERALERYKDRWGVGYLARMEFRRGDLFKEALAGV